MRVQLLLLADYASISQDGKLNVMGIFRGINSTGFPTTHSVMYLVVSLVAELGEVGQIRDITIKLVDADGAEQFAVKGAADLKNEEGLLMPEVNTIIQLRDVTFQKPGPYAFVVMVDKDYKESLSLQVNQV